MIPRVVIIILTFTGGKMRKKALMVGLVMILATAWCVTAHADGGDVTAWQGFWNSVGGFLYNALPWNWGGWMGK